MPEEENALWQENLLDFADVKGQDELIDAVTLAAAGNIIVRQRGTHIHPGNGVGIGSDDTLFALTDGVVKFEPHRRTRKQVSVYSA